MFKKIKRFEPNTLVVYKPIKGYKSKIFKDNEMVLYLGEVFNAPGHCAVAKRNGAVIWLVHFDEFRLPREDEI